MQIRGRCRLEAQRTGLENGHREDGVIAQLCEGKRKAVGQRVVDDVDARAIRRKQVEALPKLGGAADPQRRRHRRAAGGVGTARGEGDRQLGPVQAIVGERLAVLFQVAHAETGLMLEKLKIVDDPAHRMGVGAPVDGGGEEPSVAAPFEAV